ncbi:Tyrosine specific protein phosphatases domain-containing protein [Burkholderia pseudomallei]
MRQRLPDVFDRLYRPPAGDVRQVFALSRDDAEKLPRLPSLAIISITAPERPPARLDGFNHLLRLSFADVDFLKPELSRKAKEKLSRAFTPEQARVVRSFVEGLPDAVSSIVVHCEGGYSRSCAIALGLHRLYGYRVETMYLLQANPSILHVMTEDTERR